jgi:hypothetical protein
MVIGGMNVGIESLARVPQYDVRAFISFERMRMVRKPVVVIVGEITKELTQEESDGEEENGLRAMA